MAVHKKSGKDKKMGRPKIDPNLRKSVRFDIRVNSQVALDTEYLCEHYGVTKSELFERLVELELCRIIKI